MWTIAVDAHILRRCPHQLGLQLMMAKQRTYHVMTRIGGGWSVRREGTDRATGTFESKAQAVKCARDVARTAGGEVVVHTRDGMVQESRTYSSGGGSGKTAR